MYYSYTVYSSYYLTDQAGYPIQVIIKGCSNLTGVLTMCKFHKISDSTLLKILISFGRVLHTSPICMALQAVCVFHTLGGKDKINVLHSRSTGYFIKS